MDHKVVGQGSHKGGGRQSQNRPLVSRQGAKAVLAGHELGVRVAGQGPWTKVT